MRALLVSAGVLAPYAPLPPRDEAARLLAGAGWSASNITRVLGPVPVAPAEPARERVAEAPCAPSAPAPGLVAGPGEQRDCARWAECLSMLVRRSPTASAGHCPADCAALLDPRAADRVLALRQRRSAFDP